MKVAKTKVGFGSAYFKKGDEVSFTIKENGRHVLIAKDGGKPYILIHIDDFNEFFGEA